MAQKTAINSLPTQADQRSETTTNHFPDGTDNIIFAYILHHPGCTTEEIERALVELDLYVPRRRYGPVIIRLRDYLVRHRAPQRIAISRRPGKNRYQFHVFPYFGTTNTSGAASQK